MESGEGEIRFDGHRVGPKDDPEESTEGPRSDLRFVTQVVCGFHTRKFSYSVIGGDDEC